MTPPRMKSSARQPVMHAHIPGVPPRPEEPGRPFRPSIPGIPLTPGAPDWFPSSPPEAPGPVQPTRVWLDPHADWKSKLYERLMAKRIVLASGFLDDDAAARLSAQLLTLDAEEKTPIRLELQNLRAELSAVLTVMGILDVLRVPVHACVSGEITGPALGVLASCPHRSGYPNASFVLAEPKLHFGGTVTALTAREQQMTRMLDTLYFRLAEVTGREVDQIRDDAHRGRTLTTAQAIGYGLIQNQEPASRRPPRPGGRPGPAGLAGPFGLARVKAWSANSARTGLRIGSAHPEKLPSVHTRSQSVTSNRGLSRLDEKV